MVRSLAACTPLLAALVQLPCCFPAPLLLHFVPVASQTVWSGRLAACKHAAWPNIMGQRQAASLAKSQLAVAAPIQADVVSSPAVNTALGKKRGRAPSAGLLSTTPASPLSFKLPLGLDSVSPSLAVHNPGGDEGDDAATHMDAPPASPGIDPETPAKTPGRRRTRASTLAPATPQPASTPKAAGSTSDLPDPPTSASTPATPVAKRRGRKAPTQLASPAATPSSTPAATPSATPAATPDTTPCPSGGAAAPGVEGAEVEGEVASTPPAAKRGRRSQTPARSRASPAATEGKEEVQEAAKPKVVRKSKAAKGADVAAALESQSEVGAGFMLYDTYAHVRAFQMLFPGSEMLPLLHSPPRSPAQVNTTSPSSLLDLPASLAASNGAPPPESLDASTMLTSPLVPMAVTAQTPPMQPADGRMAATDAGKRPAWQLAEGADANTSRLHSLLPHRLTHVSHSSVLTYHAEDLDPVSAAVVVVQLEAEQAKIAALLAERQAQVKLVEGGAGDDDDNGGAAGAKRGKGKAKAAASVEAVEPVEVTTAPKKGRKSKKAIEAEAKAEAEAAAAASIAAEEAELAKQAAEAAGSQAVVVTPGGFVKQTATRVVLHPYLQSHPYAPNFDECVLCTGVEVKKEDGDVGGRDDELPAEVQAVVEATAAAIQPGTKSEVKAGNALEFVAPLLIPSSLLSEHMHPGEDAAFNATTRANPWPKIVPNLGYACLCATLRVWEVYSSRDCVQVSKPILASACPVCLTHVPCDDAVQKTFLEKGLPHVSSLALANAKDLGALIRWNARHGIQLFRLSSGIFPWMTKYQLEDLPDFPAIKQALFEAGEAARAVGQRLTFHPSEFCKIAADDDRNKINIHVGGAYGDKEATLRRFAKVVNERLSPNCKARLCVENDDRGSLYSVKDLLLVHQLAGVPITFDFHHHKFQTGGWDEQTAFEAAIATWPPGVRPVVHWSEARDDKRPQAHSDYVYGPINLYGREAEVDVMIESKAKELALLKARQLVYASISGLSATEEGLPLYHEECQTLGRLITQASSSQAHDVVSASITCLKSLGVTHASELSCKGNTHIITGSMLTSKYGKKVKQKHIIALNKLAAMAAQPSCPDATATRAIRDSRNTSLDLPPDQRKITTWAAGLTELAPTPAVPDTKTRYMDMKAYAAMHATQPATADRAAAAPAVHDATRTSSRLLKREQRATQSAPTKPTPPKAGTKRNNEGRQTQTIPQDIVRIVGLDLPGLSSWKVDKACRCKPKNLGCILGAMYGHQEAITSIDGWQWDGINKENYYKVHWKPTVIDRWALPLCAEEGYTPTHIETISREEAKDVCTCELCWLPRGDSPTCHNCKRAYHPACLEEAHLSGHKEPGYWLCPICKFGSNDFKTTMRQSAHSDLIRVHWQPTLEPAPLIMAHLDYMAKRNDYDEENRQIQEARHARPDAHLPAHTRQGLPDPHTWLPRCTNLHSKATFHTYPINPQTDIVGTGNCETFLQLHPHMTAPAMSLSTGEPIMPRQDLVQHVTVHDESGRTVGLLTKDQHQQLHAWLQHTPHTRNLATEVVALLRRQDAQSSHHPMRGAQDKALNTLHTTRSFPSTVQRWADPLTVRPETTTYWSPDTNDTAFGAHHNCLLVRHTGLSTWNVPADDAVALKCVNHAIHSATQEEAMATIMLIPGKKGISYPKHIDTLRRYPEYCQHLASIPPTKTRCPKPGKHAKLHIYVIWNAAGQQLVTKGNPQGWLASTATALHPQRDTHPIRNRPTNQSQPATPASGHKQHIRLPLDRDLPTSGHQRSHNQLTEHSTTQPRMAITEWATIAYSDGSCIKTSGAAPASVGAGVYIPENNILITVALDDPESNTINKAELTAIHAALKAGAKRIATDSLCSLYQIRRALANPMSLITHRHNDILTAIATLIIDSPVTIQFYKVRAHSGIIGNEGADALAKHAALHPELANTPAYSPTTRRETKNWLSNAADGDSPAPLPDCRQSVREHMHRKHKLGLANQDSIYYQMSQEIKKVAATGAGERVMIDTNIPTHAQRTALLYRTGGLYNQKLAMRWKRATDARCPLCGEADSATHLLSGCNETLPLVQERHNGAGRLITKAISKGTLGGYISFADTGSWEKGAKESLDLPSDTLHTTLRTLGLKPDDTKHTTRPDILMVLPHKKASKEGKDTKLVNIIEIKYCSDSRWTDQLNKALTQHTHLAETIRKEDHMVAIIPILLGIAPSRPADNQHITSASALTHQPYPAGG
ncbi:hypothetical protein QJQ45_018245 [Haematococcus lacustris]|nr:hypothetical protein QJQ45_018245 [Haematococcus lacustris]